eukprot:scaffold7020_cov430-Prasinococcus_capsulatus_cf.AAC.9
MDSAKGWETAMEMDSAKGLEDLARTTAVHLTSLSPKIREVETRGTPQRRIRCRPPVRTCDSDHVQM